MYLPKVRKGLEHHRKTAQKSQCKISAELYKSKFINNHTSQEKDFVVTDSGKYRLLLMLQLVLHYVRYMPRTKKSTPATYIQPRY